MVINKRAQFFLLAAVIISVVVLSFGITTNRVRVNEEPEGFYDFSYEVKRETGAILDYDIYSGFDSDANLEEFIELLAADILDKDSDVTFKIVYGDDTGLIERDFTDTTGSTVEVISKLSLGRFHKDVEETVRDFDDDDDEWIRKYDSDEIGDSDSFSVNIEGYDFSFPISKHKQVIFIIQKEVEDEIFVTAE